MGETACVVVEGPPARARGRAGVCVWCMHVVFMYIFRVLKFKAQALAIRKRGFTYVVVQSRSKARQAPLSTEALVHVATTTDITNLKKINPHRGNTQRAKWPTSTRAAWQKVWLRWRSRRRRRATWSSIRGRRPAT